MISDNIGVNQNQGGTTYPFDSEGVTSACNNTFIGVAADIRVVSDKFLNEKEVFVKIKHTNDKTFANLIFTDSTGKKLLDTDDLKCLDRPESSDTNTDRFWFFIDEAGKGRDAVYYWEYDHTPNSTLKMDKSAKLVSRCWSSGVKNIYYDTTSAPYSNQLKLEFSEGLSAKVEGNTITINATVIGQDDENTNETLQTINGVPGDTNNNINIFGDQKCITVSKDSDANNTLKIWNDCSACCDCGDYDEIYKTLNKLVDIYNYEINYLHYLKYYYDSLKAYYDECTDSRMKDAVQLKIVQDKKQISTWFSISNPSNQNFYNLETTLTITASNSPTNNTLTVKRVFANNAEVSGNCGENVIVTTNSLSYTFKINEIRAHGTWVGSLSFTTKAIGTNMAVEAKLSVPKDIKPYVYDWKSNTSTTNPPVVTKKLPLTTSVKVCSTGTENKSVPINKAMKLPKKPVWDPAVDWCNAD